MKRSIADVSEPATPKQIEERARLAAKLHGDVRRRHLLSHREMAKLDAKQTASRDAARRRNPRGTGGLTRAQENELAWLFHYAEGDVAKLRSGLGSALDRGRDRIPRPSSPSERQATDEERERTARAIRITGALSQIHATHANVLMRFYGPGEYASLAAWQKWAPLIGAIRTQPRGEKIRRVFVSETKHAEILADPTISGEIKRKYVSSSTIAVPVESGEELFTRQEIHRSLNNLARHVQRRGRVTDNFGGNNIELNRAIIRASGHGRGANADDAEKVRLEAIMDQRQHDAYMNDARTMLAKAEGAYASVRGEVEAQKRKRQRPKAAATREHLVRLGQAAKVLRKDVDTIRVWFDAGRLGEKRYVGTQRRIVVNAPADITDEQLAKMLLAKVDEARD
jgi:hypothetical protein